MAVSLLPTANDAQEREMSRHQRGLVDTCFEEGQYESGISILEQLRSPQFKPSESYIRQLLYIALYPPPLPLAINEKGKEKEAKEPFEPTTPSKSTVKQAQRSPLVPSLRATEAALRVLVSFAITNSPGSLARALPECLNVSDWNAKLTEVDENLEEDSYIAREAMCIKEARHAWAILREGLIQRKTAAPTIPKGKGKKRRRDYEYVEEEEIRFDGDGVAPLAIVAEHAWPILDWLLMVFESDELITEKSGLTRHSPLLLRQIPPPRSGTGPRWEADVPLDIVFFCLQQTNLKRKTLGARLMSLLINLTSTIHFDMNLFVTSMYTRLSSTSTATATDTFSVLFSILVPSSTVAKFKVFLCKKYLTSSAAPSSDADSSQFTSRPKPQARAVRAARRSGISEHEREGNTQSITRVNSSSTSATTSVASKQPLPTPAEIIQLIEKTDSSVCPSTFLRIKFELLLSYASLQNSVAELQDQRSEWRDMLQDGRIHTVVDSEFRGKEAQMYLESLRAVMMTWY